jgi:hypothetical protein
MPSNEVVNHKHSTIGYIRVYNVLLSSPDGA